MLVLTPYSLQNYEISFPYEQDTLVMASILLLIFLSLLLPGNSVWVFLLLQS